SFLFQIYDLEDLLTRPLLLNMTVQTILAGKIDIKNQALQIGPATLYELYTQLSAHRDHRRETAQFLTGGGRLSVCREIALSMLRKNTNILSGSEVSEAVDRAQLSCVKRSKDGREDLERAVTDVRVCTFLSFTDNGSLRFTHKSFFEFFVAQSLAIF